MNDNNFFDIQYLTKEFLETIKGEYEIFQFIKPYGPNWEGLIPGSLVLTKFNGVNYVTYRFNFTKNKKRLYKKECCINAIPPEYFFKSYKKIEFNDIPNLSTKYNVSECLHIDKDGESTWVMLNKNCDYDERPIYQCSKCNKIV